MDGAAVFSFLILAYYALYASAVFILFRCLQRAPVDHVSCHLFFLNVCFTAQLTVDVADIIVFIIDSKLEIGAVLNYLAPFYYMLLTLYVSIGTCTFLLSAFYIYSVANIRTTTYRVLFSFSYLLATAFSLSYAISMRIAGFIVSIVVFTAFTIVIILIIALLVNYIQTSHKAYLQRRHLFFSVSYSGLTVALYLPRYVAAASLLFDFSIRTNDVEFLFLIKYNFLMLNRLFPVITIVLAFCFFSSLRHHAYTLPWLPPQLLPSHPSAVCSLSAVYSQNNDSVRLGTSTLHRQQRHHPVQPSAPPASPPPPPPSAPPPYFYSLSNNHRPFD